MPAAAGILGSVWMCSALGSSIIQFDWFCFRGWLGEIIIITTMITTTTTTTTTVLYLFGGFEIPFIT